jgi:hypothetical protein
VTTSSPGEVCCGGPPPPPSNPWERPGYDLCRYVEGFLQTPGGLIPKVRTELDRFDRKGATRVRMGIGRSTYRVSPGLYAVGHPDPDSPLLVTANYKLTFDTLRSNLKQKNVWILVLDTCGVNVWCSAGKGTFSSEEVIRQVKKWNIDHVVRHRTLILPQLSATGVCARTVKKETGFGVSWGPVRASDIPGFLDAGMRATPAMRRVTFTLSERAVLIGVELSAVPKPSLWVLLAICLISGIEPGLFSHSHVAIRALIATAGFLAGVAAGAVVVPLLLPWLPGRAFSIKGAVVGLCLGTAIAVGLREFMHPWAAPAMVLLTSSVSSYLAMNFTGSTPFTSPSGVEKEMRRAIPLQAAALVIASMVWVGSAFSG